MNTSDIDKPTIEPRWFKLFAMIESKFEASNIASEKWYLTTLSAIATISESHLCGQLYLYYLTSQHAHSTTTTRWKLIRRMRETLFKDIALLGPNPQMHSSVSPKSCPRKMGNVPPPEKAGSATTQIMRAAWIG